MASVSVVVIEPGGKGAVPVVVAGEDLAVGPSGEQGAVEAFHLAVLPGAVWLDEDLPGPDLGAYPRSDQRQAQVLSVMMRSIRVMP